MKNAVQFPLVVIIMVISFSGIRSAVAQQQATVNRAMVAEVVVTVALEPMWNVKSVRAGMEITRTDGSGHRTTATVRFNNEGMTVRSIVGSLRGITGQTRRTVMNSIAIENLSLPVGTLEVNKWTGELVLAYSCNPEFSTPSQLSHVIKRILAITPRYTGLLQIEQSENTTED